MVERIDGLGRAEHEATLMITARTTFHLQYGDVRTGGLSEQIGEKPSCEETARARLTLGNGFDPLGAVEAAPTPGCAALWLKVPQPRVEKQLRQTAPERVCRKVRESDLCHSVSAHRKRLGQCEVECITRGVAGCAQTAGRGVRSNFLRE